MPTHALGTIGGSRASRGATGRVPPGHVLVGGLGAVLLWATAAVHLRLYALGYDRIPTIGRLFLLQGVAGAVLGIGVILARHHLVYLAGAGFMVASIGGFLTSLWFGLFGFSDNFAAPYAGLAMTVEALGVVVLLAAAGLRALRPV